jgi:hypothetical protein
MKGILFVVLSLVLPVVAHAQAASRVGTGYPVSGGFAFVDKANPQTTIEACRALTKFGLKRLSGNSAGELIYFDRNRRLDFGGYADTETENISVKPISSQEFEVIDQGYDDGEGGGRPGPKKKKYTLRILDPATLEIVDQYGAARYTKCR